MFPGCLDSAASDGQEDFQAYAAYQGLSEEDRAVDSEGRGMVAHGESMMLG